MAKLVTLNNIKTRRSIPRTKSRFIFFCLIMLIPVIQFAVFYIYVNFNSILMAFSKFKDTGHGYEQIIGWSEFTSNMKNVFNLFRKRPEIITNSLILFLFETGLGLPLALIFSFYLYKKKPMSKIFRVTLFMPQIISGVIFASIYYNFTSIIAAVLNNPNLDILSSSVPIEVNRAAMIIFSVLMSFGVNVLLFSGNMANVNPSLVEAAELDGCTTFGEFIHVTIPSIFPTIISFLVVGIAGIFTNQMYLAYMNGLPSNLDTVGYFLYIQASRRNYTFDSLTDLSYPALSCISILITLVLFPVTLGVKKLLEKYGPSSK